MTMCMTLSSKLDVRACHWMRSGERHVHVAYMRPGERSITASTQAGPATVRTREGLEPGKEKMDSFDHCMDRSFKQSASWRSISDFQDPISAVSHPTQPCNGSRRRSRRAGRDISGRYPREKDTRERLVGCIPYVPLSTAVEGRGCVGTPRFLAAGERASWRGDQRRAALPRQVLCDVNPWMAEGCYQYPPLLTIIGCPTFAVWICHGQ